MSQLAVPARFRGAIHASVSTLIDKILQFVSAYKADKAARRMIVAIFAVNLVWIVVHIALSAIGYFEFYDDILFITELRLTTDRGYPEMFNYAQLLLIVSVLLYAFVRTRQSIYMFFFAVFAFALLEDAFMIHESIGDYARTSGMPAPSSIRAYNFAQALYWLAAGAVFAILFAWSYAYNEVEDRKIGAIFLCLSGMIAFFAAFVDVVHAILKRAFVASNMVFSVIEEGGEMLSISLTLGAALILYLHIDELRRPA